MRYYKILFLTVIFLNLFVEQSTMSMFKQPLTNKRVEDIKKQHQQYPDVKNNEKLQQWILAEKSNLTTKQIIDLAKKKQDFVKRPLIIEEDHKVIYTDKERELFRGTLLYRPSGFFLNQSNLAKNLEKNLVDNSKDQQIVLTEYNQMYEKEREKLDPEIQNYHENIFPKTIEALSKVDYHIPKIKSIYDKVYQAYKSSNSSKIANYYNLTQIINALEQIKEGYGERILLRDYCLDYASFYEGDDNRNFILKDVSFNNQFDDSTIDPSWVGVYRPSKSTINFNPNKLFHQSALSEQAVTVMHELEHATQANIRGYARSYVLERNAEVRAVKECNCSMCLDVVSALLKHKVPMDICSGYYDSALFKYEADKTTNLCKAHASHDLTNLKKAIEKNKEEAIMAEDNKIGTLYDRLPIVRMTDLD